MLQQITCILLYVCFHVLQQNTAQQAHGLPGACCRCCCRQSLPQVAFSAHTRHPNIVQLLDVFADKERRTLVIVVRGTEYGDIVLLLQRKYQADCIAAHLQATLDQEKLLAMYRARGKAYSRHGCSACVACAPIIMLHSGCERACSCTAGL